MSDTYKQISKLTADVVTLSEMKAWLKVAPSVTLEDALIQSLINTSVIRAEKKMSRDILTTTWENYRETFYSDLTLRRGAFQSVEKIEHRVDETEPYVILDAAEYVVSIGGSFGIICKIDPSNVSSIFSECNRIRITFKTGFGDDGSDVPSDIKTAIMLDVTNIFSNRGDCKGSNFDIPDAAAGTYRSYRLIDAGDVGRDLREARVYGSGISI